MNAILSIGIALMVATFPGHVSPNAENLVERILPDARIGLVLDFVADVSIARQKTDERITEVTAEWKRKRQKDLTPFLGDGVITLEAWLYQENTENLRWPVQEFKRVAPNITIAFQTFSQERAYLNSLKHALATGETPDIVMVKNGWIKEIKNDLQPAPTALYRPDECRDFFFEFTCDAFSDEDETLAIPLFVRTLLMIVNRDLLRDDRIVVGDRPSKIWADFFSDQKNFAKFNEDNKQSFLFLDHPDKSNTVARLFALLMLQSGEDQPSEAVLTDGISLIKSLYQFSLAPGRRHDPFEKNAVELFLEGNTAVIFGTEEEYLEITRSFLSGTNSKLKDSAVGVYAMPQVAVGRDVTLGETWGLAVPRTAPHPEQAWAFLTYLSEEESILSYGQRSKKTPSRKAIAEFNIFRDSAMLAKNPTAPFDALDFYDLFAKNIAALLLEKPPKDVPPTTVADVVAAISSFRDQYDSQNAQN